VSRKLLSDLGCLLAACVPAVLFGGLMLLLPAGGIDWEHQAAGGNFGLLGMLLAGPMIVAATWVVIRRATGHGYTMETIGGFQLDVMSNERLLALWQSLENDPRPSSLAPERVAALREAILDVATRRGLELDLTVATDGTTHGI